MARLRVPNRTTAYTDEYEYGLVLPFKGQETVELLYFRGMIPSHSIAAGGLRRRITLNHRRAELRQRQVVCDRIATGQSLNLRTKFNYCETSALF